MSMKPRCPTLVFAAALLVLPAAAWADRNPDFDDDATPILRMQPGLLEYVESRFEVKDTGTAKYPGNDDRHPEPPYIFRAKPRGAPGGYNLRLLIQPGPVGHILNIVDITKVHLQTPSNTPAPSVGNQQPSTPPPAPAPAPQARAPQQVSPTQTEPTADTPSGPVTTDNNKGGAAPLPPPPPSAPPSLEPPPDPAPSPNPK
jgi:hypothetical protein